LEALPPAKFRAPFPSSDKTQGLEGEESANPAPPRAVLENCLNKASGSVKMPFVRFFAVLLALFALSGGASAQLRQAQTSYSRCVEFFVRQDNPQIAEQFCNTAVQFAPEVAEYQRMYARVLLANGNPDGAEGALNAARARAVVPENDLIAAEIALYRSDLQTALDSARAALGAPGLQRLETIRALRVTGTVLARQSLDEEALADLERAIALEPRDVRLRRAAADLYLKREPRRAVALLELAPLKTAPILADLGRAQWVAGDLTAAIQTLEGITGRVQSFSSERETYQRALGALAYAYYGQGRFNEGNRVLTLMDNQGNLFALFISRSLPWLLGILLLLVLHLLGESRIEPLSTIEIQDGPRPWTVAVVYTWLLLAVLVGGVAALVGGNLIYGNFLAILTPYQSGTIKDLYFVCFALTLFALSLQTTASNGWNVRDQLFGKARREVALDGPAVGLVMLAAALLYQFGVHFINFKGFYLDLSTWRTTLALAMLILPLSEVYFRAFALYPMEKRYGQGIAYAILSVIYALALTSPLPLLIGFGVGLLHFTNRAGGTLPAIVAQWVFHVGLLIALAIPAVRTWF
jgi:tetratricopeptide (TPR) repeat protein